MEKVTKNILIQKDFSSQLLTPKRSSKTSALHLQDLNYDCLREVLKHLDIAAQFSLLKSSKQFLNVILYDIWYPCYDDTFDITKDQSIEKQTKDFQTDFLKLILKKFAKIKGISLEIFQKFMNKTTVKEFTNILALSIDNSKTNKTENNTFDFMEFCKFPFLQELQLENLSIAFPDKDNGLDLKFLHLKNISVPNDKKGIFLKNVLSFNMEKFSLTLPTNFICFQNFSEISKCLHLQELTLSSHFLYDPRILDCILILPSLQMLTLESSDNFYFTSRDHAIFYFILKIFSENAYKSIRDLHINGIPEKTFYLCPYLQDVRSLNWIVTKIFHRKSDGCVEWKSDISQVINSFYDFLVENSGLERVFVRDNICHKKRVIAEVDFVEKLQHLRRAKGYERLNIVNNYEQFNISEILCDLAEGSMRFFIEKRE